MQTQPKQVPVTVLTGYLGSGKTSLILSVLPSLPTTYKLAILKNEFGDIEIDSLLLRQAQERQSSQPSSSFAVREVLNGCMCCVLVGQMSTALRELRDLYQPDRIIFETSGSAFPAPIAWQIRQLTGEGFVLDAILTVVDCVHFRGYEDVSYTAKMQAQYTDLILLNKHELVSERELDLVVDHVNDLNTDTPKIKISPKTKPINSELIFGLDSQLFTTKLQVDALSHEQVTDHHDREVDLITIICKTTPTRFQADLPKNIVNYFTSTKLFSKETVFRVKGTVHDTNGDVFVINVAFGRADDPTLLQRDIFPADSDTLRYAVRLTIMGLDLRHIVKVICHDLSLDRLDTKTSDITSTNYLLLHERSTDHNH